jgi:tRNA nucleotidyltransferase (CCA-adding enzyme)
VSARLPDLLSVPPRVLALVRGCAAVGGRALLVGGCVRDALMGRAGDDLDIEVHGIDPVALRDLARAHGRVDEVGRAFGVLKVRLGPDTVDVSVPRRDSKIGDGHRGIRADADPQLGVVEAARRRDLTLNAIAWDPLTGEVIDPFGGVGDLRAGRLHAVDPTTFPEDPLRALRVAQFAARFGFTATTELTALCREMDVSGLPAERVRGEVEKLLLKGRSPSAGWTFARATGLWARLLPEWDRAAPGALDPLARLPIDPPPRRLALLYACTGSAGGLVQVLDRLRVHSWLGYDVRSQAVALATAAQVDPDPRPAATRARWLAEDLEVELLAALTGDEPLARAASELGVGRAPLVPLLSGRDVLALGVQAGASVGELLKQVRRAQLDGHVSSPAEALEWARAQVR